MNRQAPDINEKTPAILELEKQAIPFGTFHHPNEIQSLEQAAEERHQKPEQVVRSIVFRLAEKSFVMVLIAGPSQISWQALRKFLGQSRLSMASPEEVLEATGYVIGSVSPFGLPQPMRILVDQNVMKQGTISIGSGTRGTAIILKVIDLLRTLPRLEVGDFCGECD
jgi:Cys-tRNA(Pro)/Cys-tRNA(Cys) deacylase